MMAVSVSKWPQGEVCNLFSKLKRRDIAEALRTLECTGASFLEIEWLAEEGLVAGLTDSQLHYVLNIISFMTGRSI